MAPSSICVDKEGNYWIADTWNDRVQKLSMNGYFMMKIENIPNPLAVLVDDNGKIIVTDSEGHISVYNNDGSMISRFSRHGKENGELNKPSYMTLNSIGQLIVCDTNNHRLSIFV